MGPCKWIGRDMGRGRFLGASGNRRYGTELHPPLMVIYFSLWSALSGRGGRDFGTAAIVLPLRTPFGVSNAPQSLKAPQNFLFSSSISFSFLLSHPPLPSVILPSFQNASYSVSSALQRAHYGYPHRGPGLSRRDRRFLRCLTGAKLQKRHLWQGRQQPPLPSLPIKIGEKK